MNLEKLVGFRYTMNDPKVDLFLENGVTKTVTDFKIGEEPATIQEYTTMLLETLQKRCGAFAQYTDELKFTGYILFPASAVFITKEQPKTRKYLGEEKIDVIFKYGETEHTFILGSEAELQNSRAAFESQLRMMQEQ